MEVSAVLLARAIAFVDINDLNPHGKLFFPHIIPLLQERFAFSKLPTKPEDFNEDKGVEFLNGYYAGQTIDNLTVYGDGIKIDVRSSTEHGQAILRETLGWLADSVGLRYTESMLSRWAFVSQFTFHSSVDLNKINPAIAALAERLTRKVEEETGAVRKFSTSAVALNFERLEGKIHMGQFTIERRANTRFREGKYYTSAPLQTLSHIALIEQFERDMVQR